MAGPFLAAGGVEVRVGSGHGGVDGLSPGRELTLEGGGPAREDGSEVLLFADVVLEIVEFACAVGEELDQLPVAIADRAGGGRVVVDRIVPVDGAVLEAASLAEQRHQALAVKGLGCGLAGAGDL